jgi:hypothetical protein
MILNAIEIIIKIHLYAILLYKSLKIKILLLIPIIFLDLSIDLLMALS